MQPLQTYIDVATLIHKLHTLQTKYNKRLDCWFDEDWAEPDMIIKWLNRDIEVFYKQLQYDTQREYNSIEDKSSKEARELFEILHDCVDYFTSDRSKEEQALITSSDTIDTLGLSNSYYTLQYYNNNALNFFDSTVNIDMSKTCSRFLEYIPQGSKILDVGCGSGRDSKYFKELGYNVTAIEPSYYLRILAEDLIKQSILSKGVEDIEFDNEFDGIWCSASLLHLDNNDLNIAITNINKALKDTGSIYMSFKYGNDTRTDDNGRFFNNMTEDKFTNIIKEFPTLSIDRMWQSFDARPERANEVWLNIILTKEDIISEEPDISDKDSIKQFNNIQNRWNNE